MNFSTVVCNGFSGKTQTGCCCESRGVRSRKRVALRHFTGRCFSLQLSVISPNLYQMSFSTLCSMYKPYDNKSLRFPRRQQYAYAQFREKRGVQRERNTGRMTKEYYMPSSCQRGKIFCILTQKYYLFIFTTMIQNQSHKDTSLRTYFIHHIL